MNRLQSKCSDGRERIITDEKNNDDPIKQIPVRDLKIYPTAEDLIESLAMVPYMNLAIAVMRQARSENR
jgi:hypothetical protein